MAGTEEHSLPGHLSRRQEVPFGRELVLLIVSLPHCAPAPFQRLVSIAGFSRTKATSPTVAPPRHVADKLPVGHTARAAWTHSSQRTLEMLILAPSLSAVRVNLALPLRPTVVDGDPPHWDVEPDIPSQMASWAAFSSWKMIFL